MNEYPQNLPDSQRVKPPLHRDKILCVDDDGLMLTLFEWALKDHFEVHTRYCTEQALNVLHEQADICVIISDYHMPGMNGIEFLQQARQISPDSVQMLHSSVCDHEIMVKIINETNIFRFLPKPANITTLQRCVTQARAHYHVSKATQWLNHRSVQTRVLASAKGDEFNAGNTAC